MDSFIQIKSFGIKEAQKSLSLLEKSQFPFAYALALTRIAQRGQQVAREKTKKQFQLHGEFIPNSIRIHGAQKSDIQMYGIAQSEIYTTEKIAFMTLHETGGVKKPWFHQSLALPSIAMKVVSGFRTGSGKIATKFRPAALLKYWNAYKGGKRPKRKVKAKEPRAFVAKGKVLVRLGPERYPLQTLYQLEKTTKIKPLWGIEPLVRVTVEREFEGVFRKCLSEAMGSMVSP